MLRVGPRRDAAVRDAIRPERRGAPRGAGRQHGAGAGGVRRCGRRGRSDGRRVCLRGPQGSGHLHGDAAEALQRIPRHLRRAAALRGGASREGEERAVSGAGAAAPGVL